MRYFVSRNMCEHNGETRTGDTVSGKPSGQISVLGGHFCVVYFSTLIISLRSRLKTKSGKKAMNNEVSFVARFCSETGPSRSTWHREQR